MNGQYVTDIVLQIIHAALLASRKWRTAWKLERLSRIDVYIFTTYEKLAYFKVGHVHFL
jgi:hypothetical protein